MTQITHHSHYDAPIDVVFRRGLDSELMKEFWPKVKRVWDVVGRQDAPGDRLRFQEHIFGVDLEGTREVRCRRSAPPVRDADHV